MEQSRDARAGIPAPDRIGCIIFGKEKGYRVAARKKVKVFYE